MKLLSRLRSGLLGRAAWNLVDQVVVSLTNSVLTIVVARSVDAVTLGGFAVAFTVFAVLIGISRAVAASPLAVRFSDADDEAFREASASALGVSLVLGVAGGAVLLAVGALLGDAGGQGLLALGLVLPGLLVQDTWRQVFFASGRPAAAAVNSIVWTVGQFAAVAVLLASGLGTVLMLVLAWGGAALVAALLGVAQSGTAPRPSRVLQWWREHRDLAATDVANFSVQQGAMQGTLLLLGIVATVAAIGTVRTTLVLLGVTSVLAMATISFALPEISRRRRSLSERQWYLVTVALSGLVAGVGVVWGLVFLLAPDALGRGVLGDAWDGVRAVLLPAIIGQALLAAGLGPSTIVRAMDRSQVSLRRNLVMSPLILLGGVVGTLLGGAAGTFWGFAAAYAVGVPLWAVVVRREVRAFVARRDEPEEPDAAPVRLPVEPVDSYFTDMGTMQMPTMQLRAVRPRPVRPAPPVARPVAPPVPVARPVGPPAPPQRVPVPLGAVAAAEATRAMPAAAVPDADGTRAVPSASETPVDADGTRAMAPIAGTPVDADGTRAMPLAPGTPVDGDGTTALPVSPPPAAPVSPPPAAPVRPPGAAAVGGPPPRGLPPGSGRPGPHIRPGPGAAPPPPGPWRPGPHGAPGGPAARPPAGPGRPAGPGPARPGAAPSGPHPAPPGGRPGWRPPPPGPGWPGRPPHGPGPGAHGPSGPGPHRPGQRGAGPQNPGQQNPGQQGPGQQGSAPQGAGPHGAGRAGAAQLRPGQQQGPGQPGSRQQGSGQPGSGQQGPGRPGPAQPGPDQPSRSRPAPAQQAPAQPGPGQQAPARSVPGRPGSGSPAPDPQPPAGGPAGSRPDGAPSPSPSPRPRPDGAPGGAHAAPVVEETVSAGSVPTPQRDEPDGDPSAERA